MLESPKLSVAANMYPIWEVLSSFEAKDASAKTIILAEAESSFLNIKPFQDYYSTLRVRYSSILNLRVLVVALAHILITDKVHRVDTLLWYMHLLPFSIHKRRM